MTKSAAARVVATDEAIDAALERAKAYDKFRPRAVSARYDEESDAFALRLHTGVQMIVPRRLLQGLESATPGELAEIEVEDFGSGLHWPFLGVDHYVPGLIAGIYGSAKWMERLAARMPAKAETKVRVVTNMAFVEVKNAHSKGATRGGIADAMRGGALDARYRDVDGEIRVKSGSTRVSELRQTYGPDFAKGVRGDTKLDTLLKETGAKSIADLQKKKK